MTFDSYQISSRCYAILLDDEIASFKIMCVDDTSSGRIPHAHFLMVPSLCSAAAFATLFCLSRISTVLLHELAHTIVAAGLGWTVRSVGLPSLFSYCKGGPAGNVHVPGIAGFHAKLVRHAGWMTSTCITIKLWFMATAPVSVILASLWTALDAVSSDLLQVEATGVRSDVFCCGNFGILILVGVQRSRAYKLLREMLRVTMVRGAQSAGVVTYEQGTRGVRTRIVNRKRTDLSDLLVKELNGPNILMSRLSSIIPGERFYQGHTRFATSSIANLEGCHPHQWTPRSLQTVWRFQKGVFVATLANVESFITHNGDLDLFEIHGLSYTLEDLQATLTHFLDAPPPAEVDSAVIAGLLDLLRTKGLWEASVRYGYIFGALASSSQKVSLLLPQLASHAELNRIAAAFETEWKRLLNEEQAVHEPKSSSHGRALPPDSSMVEPTLVRLLSAQLEARLLALMVGDSPSLCVRPLESADVESISAFIKQTIHGFFFQDLLEAAFTLLRGAEGSFGLVLSHSLDAKSEFVIAARGQTMSVSFYPSSGLVAFGSEASATKVPMQAGEKDSFRFDLDNVVGEVLLLRWGESPRSRDSASGSQSGGRPHLIHGAQPRMGTEIFSYGDKMLVGANFLEDRSSRPFWDRRLQLGGNPLVMRPLNITSRDLVGDDLLEIPRVMRRIEDDWAKGPEALNRRTAWNLASKLRERLLSAARSQKRSTAVHNGSVDLLLVGCEVSLWLAEQFAADLHLVFPKLKVVAISANKLLGQLGQQYPMPQLGFSFNQHTYSLRDSIVIVLSQSGGTFGSLACCNLLRGWTTNIFAVTSEWDTQVARSVGETQSQQLGSSYVFSTFSGFRPAEPCSLTVVAMHHLLSHLLIFIMSYVGHFDKGLGLGGSTYVMEEVKELEALKRNQVQAVEEIVGRGRLGDTATSAQLRAQGKVWGQHALEGPISWIMSLVYIAATIISHQTPAGAIAEVALGHRLPTWSSDDPNAAELALSYLVAVFDVIVYAFLPWWTTVLLRLIQRRPWLHRVSGRSVLIGDIPWVAQSVEAFASKCFSLTYSISAVNFHSANPNDHLVHRHTHRVVRGSLLAVGRPDGRLNSLTTAEAACCLSLNQASSIQNFGVTCESITIGHNPFKLPLSAAAITLPTKRLDFISELLSKHDRTSEEFDLVRGPNAASSRGQTPGNSKHGGPAAQNNSRHGGLSAHGKRNSSQNNSRHGDFSAHGKRCSSPSRSLNNSVHGGQAQSRYLAQSTLMDAITHGGSVRQGNAYVNAYVNQKLATIPRAETSNSFSRFKVAASRITFIRKRCNAPVASKAKSMQLPPSASATCPSVAAIKSWAVEPSVSRQTGLKAAIPGLNKRSRSEEQHASLTGIRATLNRLQSDEGVTDKLLNTMKLKGWKDIDILKILELRVIEPLSEPFIGAWMVRKSPDTSVAKLMEQQQLLQQLNETRFDSMQRAIAFFVLFHKMGKDVADFWETVSFGLLGYDMSRSQSMLRIATTASPVSGTEVRDKMMEIAHDVKRSRAAALILLAWRKKAREQLSRKEVGAASSAS